jgi:hypothetical protein
MGLIANCLRNNVGYMCEGSALALLPGQWNSYQQFEKFIYPDQASAVLQTESNPPAYYIPTVYHPPIKVGSIASLPGGTTITFSGSLQPPIEGVLAGSASFSFTADASTLTAIGVLAGHIQPFTELSPENLALAVWAKTLESEFTAAQIMQILAAVAAGKTDNSGQTFRDLSDTKDRVTGTVSGGDRTSAAYDLD